MRPSILLRPIALPSAALSVALLLPAAASATTYNVGPSRTVHSPCALLTSAVTLAPGDVILVDAGTYNEACVIDSVNGATGMPITLRGMAGARPVINGAGQPLTGDGGTARAVLQFNNASHWSVEHLEFINGSNTTRNAAGVRVTEHSTDVSLRDLSVHDNQTGIISSTGAALAVADSEIYNNGVAGSDGVGHNLFLAGDSARITGNFIHDARGGQNLRLRLRYAEVMYNSIAHAASYEMDLVHDDDSESPDSRTVLLGNLIVRLPEATNVEQTVVFGPGTAPTAGTTASLYAAFNTFIMHDGRNRLIRAVPPTPGSTLQFTDNIVHGIPTGTLLLTGAAVAFDAANAAIFRGSNNWITAGIDAPPPLTAGLTGADPGFVSATDYDLRAGAAVTSAGVAPPPYLDGAGAMQPGTAASQFQPPLGAVPRVTLGPRPDLGAFAATSLPPPDAGTDAGTDTGTDTGSDTGTDGAFDGGAPDATADAGAGADTGSAADAPADSGAPQGNDAGTPTDTAFPTDDSGAVADAGHAGTGSGSGSGCGCAVPAESPSGGAWLLAGLAAVVASRRRRRLP